MAYTLPAWADSPSTTTPVNAANLGELNTAINGLDARASISSRPGNRIVTLGDSTTQGAWDTVNQVQGAAWPLYAQMFSGGKIFVANNAGIGGNTTAQMLARFSTDVTPFNPAAVTVMGGTNDIGNSVSLATTQANIVSIVAGVQAIGAVPVLCTIMPNNTSGRHSSISVLNHWLRRFSAAHGLALIDFYKLMVDPTNGNYLSAYFSDGTHPNEAGISVMGQAAASQLGPALPPWTPPLTSDNTDTSGLFASNPLLITDTNSDGIPDGWISYGGSSGFANALVTDSVTPGKLMQITQTSNASIRVLEQTVTTGFSVGDHISFCGVVTSDGGVQAQIKVNFDGNGANAQPCVFTGAVTRGVVYQEFVVPTGTTSITVDCVAGAGTGVVAWGQLTMLNLTQLGIL
jgi:lysophospholipase L1-like esterase